MNVKTFWPYYISILATLIAIAFLFSWQFRPQEHKVVIQADPCTSPDKQPLTAASLLPALESQINDAFSRTTTNLNFTLAIFSFSLTLFLVPVGLYSFRAVSESKKLLEEIERAPEKVIHKYQKQKIEESLKQLFSDDLMQQTSAATFLFNSELVDQSSFNQIKSSLSRTLEAVSYENYQLIYLLCSILMRLDMETAVSYFLSIIDTYKNNNLVRPQLLSNLIKTRNSNSIEEVKKLLLTDDRNYLFPQVVNSSPLFDLYGEFIMLNCSPEVLRNFYHQISNSHLLNQLEEKIFSCVLRRTSEVNSIMTSLLQALGKKLDSEKLKHIATKVWPQLEESEKMDFLSNIESYVIPEMITHLSESNSEWFKTNKQQLPHGIREKLKFSTSPS